MKRCKSYNSLILKYISGEINPRDKAELLRHADSCSGCSELLRTHDTLLKFSMSTDEFPESEFQQLRQNVQREIRLRGQKQESRYWNIADWLSTLFPRPVTAAVLVILFFILGYLTPGMIDGNKQLASAESALIRHISQTSSQHENLKQTQDSPYHFSNVSITDVDENTISLSFKVSRYLKMIRTKDDPVVKEILSQTLVNQNAVPDRLQLIDYTESIIDPKIKQALIIAARADPASAVRQRALTRLLEYPIDDHIKQTLLDILENDEAISMRLLAIDYLTKNNTEKDIIRKTIGAQKEGKYTAIRRKALQYITY